MQSVTSNFFDGKGVNKTKTKQTSIRKLVHRTYGIDWRTWLDGRDFLKKKSNGGFNFLDWYVSLFCFQYNREQTWETKFVESCSMKLARFFLFYNVCSRWMFMEFSLSEIEKLLWELIRRYKEFFEIKSGVNVIGELFLLSVIEKRFTQQLIKQREKFFNL